jgi:hypothetical protein
MIDDDLREIRRISAALRAELGNFDRLMTATFDQQANIIRDQSEFIRQESALVARRCNSLRKTAERQLADAEAMAEQSAA